MKRGLVLPGGGAKGAFQFGALEVLAQQGIRFDAVAGTSVGSLNALIWSTGQFEYGRDVWNNLSFSETYPVKYFTLLLRLGPWFVGNLIWHFAKNTLPGAADRLVVRAINCVRLVAVLCILYFAARTALPRFQSQQDPSLLVASTLLLLIVLALEPRTARPLLTYLLAVPASLLFFPSFGLLIAGELLGAVVYGVVAAAFCYAVYRALYWSANTTLMDPRPLRGHIKHILSDARLRIPTYVTVAKTHTLVDPDDFDAEVMMSFPITHPTGRPTQKTCWIPHYTLLSECSDSSVDSAASSAALPFGLVAGVGRDSVDGGVIDNCPLYPLITIDECDEVWVIGLEPKKASVDEEQRSWQHIQRLLDLVNWKGKIDVKTWYSTTSVHNDPPTVVPFRSAPAWPTFVHIQPTKNLGGFFRGTLRFNRRYARWAMALGKRRAKQVLRVVKSNCEQ